MKQAAVKFTNYKSSLGFWIYLMTDCLIFASLFATYIVLLPGTAGGPGPKDIFQMPLVLTETLILLTSSFTVGLAMIALSKKNIKQAIWWLAATYILGVSFLTIELFEFGVLVSEGHSWQASAFLSAFFVLVGTHGLHILIGLIWLLIMVIVLLRRGLNNKSHRQLGLFAMYWHFLDLVWIFIFTIVYLMGVAS